MRKPLLARMLGLLCAAFIGGSALAQCAPAAPWQDWMRAKAQLISPEGRVIDASDPRQITTSEGQSYALFMALVDNDPRLFRTLLQWTQTHLAQGDLNRHLPAWLWGRTEAGGWGVLDDNPASDSDLWIAYTLLEAGRLWNEYGYTLMGTRMLTSIANAEIADLPGMGPMLLPAPKGYVHEGRWRLNPSYLPPQVLQRLRLARPDAPWEPLSARVADFLTRSAPQGIAPDWISWTPDGYAELADDERSGSYNAIRVYLWVGMLPEEFPQAQQLKQHFRAITRYINEAGIVAEHIPARGGTAQGQAPVGFSAALLPLMTGQTVHAGLKQRVESARGQTLGYYNQMLLLFGKGWEEQRFRFDEQGRLIPAWKECP